MFGRSVGRRSGAVWLAAAVLAASTAWGSKTKNEPHWTLQLRRGESLATFSPDWKTVATVQPLIQGRTLVRHWEVGTSRLRRALRVPGNDEAGLVFRVLFSPDGKTLATEADAPDGTLRVHLWDLATGRRKRTLTLAEGTGMTGDAVSLAFSPDGKTLATGGLAQGPKGGYVVIRLWDVQTGTHLRRLPHASNVSSLEFSPDGKLLAGVSEFYNDLTVKLWDLQTGNVTRMLSGHGVAVRQIVFSPDGRLLAGVSENDTVRLWDLRTGRVVRTLPEPGGQLAFSPDGMSLVAVGGPMGSNEGRSVGVRLWDVQSGRLKQKLTLATESFVEAVSPDATIVATAGKGTVALWRIR